MQGSRKLDHLATGVNFRPPAYLRSTRFRSTSFRSTSFRSYEFPQYKLPQYKLPQFEIPQYKLPQLRASAVTSFRSYVFARPSSNFPWIPPKPPFDMTMMMSPGRAAATTC
jgi:hypothetical protein